MVTSYILILCISAWLIAYLLLRMGGHMAALLGKADALTPGLILAPVSIAFLAVAAAQPSMLMGAIMVYVTQLFASRTFFPRLAHWGLPFLACVFTVTHLTFPAIANVPTVVSPILAIWALFGMVMGAKSLPPQSGLIAVAVIAFTLLAAALLWHVPSYIGLDVAILTSSLLGLMMVKQPSDDYMLSLPSVALIMGWLVLKVMTYAA